MARAAYVSQGRRHLMCLPDLYVMCIMGQVHQTREEGGDHCAGSLFVCPHILL